MSTTKLSFCITDFILRVRLPTLDEPSLLGSFTRTAFQNHHQAIDAMLDLDGVSNVKSSVEKEFRELMITCSAHREPYEYMRELQEIGRRFGYFKEHQLERKKA